MARTAEQILNDIEKLMVELRQVTGAASAPAPTPIPAALSKKTKDIKNELKRPSIYVDGAFQRTGGGWAVVAYLTDCTIERGGAEFDTTNNRMELQAAIEACKLVHEMYLTNELITVYTDSEYVQKGITKWISGWLASDWRDGTIKNQDLWEELYALDQPCKIRWEWVRGHSGVEGNERADAIAQAFAMEMEIPLRNEAYQV